MNEKIVQEILDELFPYFESVETQSAAILSFLKAKGIANEEDLAPHIKQAENASSVRWRAARVRLNYLLAPALKATERQEDIKPQKFNEKDPGSVSGPDSRQSASQDAAPKEGAKTSQSNQKAGDDRKNSPETSKPDAS